MQFGRRVPTRTFQKILLYSYSGQHSCTLNKEEAGSSDTVLPDYKTSVSQTVLLSDSFRL